MRNSILEELELVAPGRVSTRASARLAKAHDASHYLVVPEVVVTAASSVEVAAITRACAELRQPLTFRSGGTSLSGQAGGAGVLVDTRRHFRGVTVLDEGARVRVQPGATVRSVNARLAPYGTKLGPDPASEIGCTVGGVVANNSSGMACGTEFNAYRTVESLVMVLTSGTVVDTSRPDADARLADLEPALHEGLLRLRDRVRSNAGSVRRVREQFAMKNTMGYGVNAFLDHDEPADILAHLMIGSEGTLGFVAEATFRTVPLRAHTATGLLVFDDLRRATRVLPELVDAGFATIELMDATSLRLCQRDAQAPAELSRLTVQAHAALLVEHQEGDAEGLAERLADSARRLPDLSPTLPPKLTSDRVGRAALWRLRKGLYTSVAGNRPQGTTALLEDVAVPGAALATLCEGLIELFDKHAYEDSVIFGHAKDGNVHFLLNERFDGPRGVDRYLDFTDDLVDLVLGAGGTLKAEHGTGRIMAPYVRRQFGDELYDVMVQLKRLCDPAGVMNPGVIINDDPRAHVRDLKPTTTVEEEVDRCVECGYCEPVCPSRDLTLTPRTRIALRRELSLARSRGDEALAAELEEDYGYDGVDTCAVDGMCQTACPVLIDTGALVARLRAERRSSASSKVWEVAARHWDVVSRAGGFALSAAHRLPAAVPAGATRTARRVLGDALPAWTPDLPRGGRPRSGLPSGHRFPIATVHFPSCMGSMFAPSTDGDGVAAAVGEIFDRAGLGLRVPVEIDELCCGTPWKSKGLPDGYETMRERVVPALWEATEHGRLPVVCEASSCAEGLQRMLAGTGDPGGIQVLDAITLVAESVLPRLPAPEKRPTAVVHPTCSSVRMGTHDALTTIARHLADRVVVPDAWGCCGFAGDRGMLLPELTASATAPEANEVTQASYDLYLSSNRTCEIGLRRATGQPYEHVLEALARAIRPSADAAPPG